MNEEEKEKFLKLIEKHIEMWKKHKNESSKKAVESKSELEHKIAKCTETYNAGGINALECLATWIRLS